jgi:hypothetical protein
LLVRIVTSRLKLASTQDEIADPNVASRICPTEVLTMVFDIYMNKIGVSRPALLRTDLRTSRKCAPLGASVIKCC